MIGWLRPWPTVEGDAMKQHSQWARFTFALAGLRAAWKTERSFRTEVIGFILVMAWMLWLKPEPIWWFAIAFGAAGILVAELLNTAIEALCDAVHPDKHPLIKVAKDCGSAAVLLTVTAGGVLLVALIARSLGWY